MSDYDSEPLPEPEPAPVEEEEPAPVEEEESDPVEEEESDPVEEEESAPVEEEESAPVEEEESAPVEEEESAPVEEEPVVEEPVVEEPVVEEAPAEESVPVEQVASEIREILNPVESANEVDVSSSPSELSDDLKQRIAELDYLRECCGNWVGSGRQGKSEFLIAWQNKNVSVDSNVNYEDTLGQLEKMPELTRKWLIQVEMDKSWEINHFQNIHDYILEKTLFKDDQEIDQKVEILEIIIYILISYANTSKRKYIRWIDNKVY